MTKHNAVVCGRKVSVFTRTNDTRTELLRHNMVLLYYIMIHAMIFTMYEPPIEYLLIPVLRWQ